MRKNAPVLLTVAIMLISTIAIAATFYVPSAEAPQLRVTLMDPDGTQSVNVGERAEYVIKIENIGETNGHVELSKQGSASGWESSLSHELVRLKPNEYRTVSLFVKPVEQDAEPQFEVNIHASRGDNVTIIGTTTYVKGLVSIKDDDNAAWGTYHPGTDIEEENSLRTAVNAHAQVSFDEYVHIAFKPESIIKCRFANENDGIRTFWFNLDKGEATFIVDLPTITSTFTLQMANGARVVITSADETIFMAQSNGLVSVFNGTIIYQPSPGRSGEGTRANIEVGAGTTSAGKSFNHAELSYDNTHYNGQIESYDGAKLGFENSGEFIADGSIDGSILRVGTMDRFFIHGGEIDYITLTLFRKDSGMLDVQFQQYTPEFKAFQYEDVDTKSAKISYTFQKDRTYTHSTSDMTYDLNIENDVGEVFTISDVSTTGGEGNNYLVLSYEDLADTTAQPIQFGKDENGDGMVDQSVDISTGMTGKEVYDSIETEKDDDETDDSAGFWLFVILILMIPLFYILYLIFFKPSGRKKTERSHTKMDREAMFARKRQAMKEAAQAKEAEEKKDIEGFGPTESWDEPMDEPTPAVGREPGMEPPPVGPTPFPGAIGSTIGTSEQEDDVLFEEPPGSPLSTPPFDDVPMPIGTTTPPFDQPLGFDDTGFKEKDTVPKGYAPEEIPENIPEEIPEDEWEPDQEDVPPEITEFKEEIQKKEYREIDRFLKERSRTEEFTPPEELREKIEKQLEDDEDWWDEWNEELNKVMRT